MTATMRAWCVESTEGDGVMRLRERPRPEPGPGQCLVRVEAAGLNFMDTLMLRGRYQDQRPLPYTPGVDIVGTVVDSASPDVHQGRRVATACDLGGFAEYALARNDHLVPLDADIEAGVAMALRSNYPTSLYALRELARLREGETLLVHAAAGGVGSAAVQLGKRLGACVIATVGGAAKVAVARALGADEVIDHRAGNWLQAVRLLQPKGCDVVYDPVGGETGAASLRCLAWGARYLVIGFASGTLTELPANRLLLHNAQAMGVLWGEARRRDPALGRRLMDDIFAWHRQGLLAPAAATAFPFEAAPQALGALASGRTTGKVLLALQPGA